MLHPTLITTSLVHNWISPPFVGIFGGDAPGEAASGYVRIVTVDDPPQVSQE